MRCIAFSVQTGLNEMFLSWQCVGVTRYSGSLFHPFMSVLPCRYGDTYTNSMVILKVISESPRELRTPTRGRTEPSTLGWAMAPLCINADGGRFLYDNEVSFADQDI